MMDARTVVHRCTYTIQCTFFCVLIIRLVTFLHSPARQSYRGREQRERGSICVHCRRREPPQTNAPRHYESARHRFMVQGLMAHAAAPNVRFRYRTYNYRPGPSSQHTQERSPPVVPLRRKHSHPRTHTHQHTHTHTHTHTSLWDSRTCRGTKTEKTSPHARKPCTHTNM